MKTVETIIDQLLSHEITRKEAIERLLVVKSSLPSRSGFKSRRKRLGLSLREVAAKIMISPATISRMERGRNCDHFCFDNLYSFYRSKGV